MAKTKVVWSPSAFLGLEEITDYIAKDAPFRAITFAELLLSSTDQLEEYPLSGGNCPENPAFRQLVIEGYRIIYEASEIQVDVVAIISPGQNANRILTPVK